MEMPSEDHQQPNDAERDSLARDLSARIYCLQPRHSVVCDSSIVSECFDSLLDQAAQVRSKPSSTRLQPKLSPGGSKSTSGLFRHEGSIISTSAASSSINGQRSLIKSESASTRDVAVSLGGERSMIVAGTNVNGSISTKGAKEKKTFLDSLKLPPEQLEALINDPGYFLYLSNASSSGLAYDLIVVEHSQINPDDYLTLSCSGMTHFSGFHSEFTPLRQWEREFGMFHRMREIPFFAKYRAWKMFTVWRKNVKRGKIKASMNALRSSLFVFIPSLRDALLKIQCLCQDTLCMTLINAQPGKTYELDEFERAQEQLLAERTSGLQVFTNDAQQLARAACDDVVDAFLKAAKIVADHRMTFMERASLRSECRKLTRFLRLVDFHVITTLRDLALESVDVAYKLAAPSSLPPRRILCDEEDRDVSFKSELDILDDEGEDTKLVPLLRVEVSYDERGVLKCSPSLSDVRNAFTNLLSQCLKAVGIPDRIFAHPDLALYVMSDSDDIPTGGDATGGSTGVSETSVSDLVAAELKYVNSSTQIQEALNSAFQEAMEYAEVFDPFYANSLENQTFHENISDIFGSGDNVDLLVYADAISKYRQQAEQFRNHLPRSADIGIFRVDSLVLKRMLVPSPLVCLDTLHARLPELMSDGFKELLDQLGEILPVVTGAPNNVPQFITKKHVVREALCKFESFKAAQHKLVEMSALMVKEGWVVPEDQKAHMVMVNENMSTLDTGLQIAEGREEDDTKRFAIEVSEEVPKIKKSIGEVRERLDSPIVSSIEEKPDNVIVFLGQQSDALATIRRRSDKLAEYQAELGQDVDEYDTLDEVSSDLDLKVRLWRGLKEWGVLTSSWVVTPLSDIDAVELETHVQTYVKTVHQASRGIPGNPVVPKLKESVDRFAPVLPVVKDLRNIALQERHWTAIHDLLGFEIKGDDAFTLGDVIDKGVTSHHKELTTISTNATQEAVLEEMMSKVSSLWESAEFEVKEYKDIKDLYILGDVSENIAALDESLVTVNTVLGSRYVSGIRPFVEKWRKDLILFQDTLDEWLACQRAWMYLESIFGSADIIRQLPAAAKQFQAVDKSWRTIMKATAEEPLALKSCCVKDRKETFVNHNATLDKIQKSLEQYLETKCAAFPRFYFLSSDELLSILSQSRDPQAVQPHMRKLFDNLVRLEFGSEPCSIDINGMYSGEGELVGLGKNLKARGQVEDWLSTVEQRMKHSLHLAMKAGLLDYEGRDRSEWVLDHPGQIVATVAQMMWARGTEKALSTADPADMTTWYQTNIDDLLGLIKQIRGDLPKLQRQKIVALVTTDVHARDIVEELITKKVSSRGDFTWMQQLRYYWERVDDTEDCVIRHSDALIHYGYEYMGCTSRLVITPLTDRCWLTLTGSYGLKLGAAPAGPAGTGMYGDCHVIIDYLSAGKTESSKDLAKAMAIQCVVFNCRYGSISPPSRIIDCLRSDQIDYKMMGKLFRGLAQSGSWTCLDE